ncbi:MAG: hypothetical protein A3G49_02705 [Candidatus Sungbacteria bacterium RIFCSPLOWO2_12_FULL_41_11]|uniref:ABC transporter n=1 Tax=Candidatus Sungbacteria bacterium RIFCSPLOWO2_12_FULL_41_11 TaxID=1802286 RepID=A0A1G2LRA2_9BACT|nr:MAG: ABC-3 protein [Parcubacteria group bacterium GW2011_GWA2_42_14]OHA00208.1 MAG: hypothetical protein A3D41_01945 [Candidatus Sungbacteria bacterium RIFCSPHIGHO2_02_FULL_41_12b]OHA14127.1 MAG: hypothetical protein A3G49_02705 [Candidatus Sungbacteria bacterium RIFCSPLOWO2_12_FULL_41_11]
MDFNFYQPYIIALIVGITSGFVGSFIILKRMALVGDALSHVALPGIALALVYSIDPFWGVLVFLLSAAVLVWWLEGKTKLPTDAVIGLLFTASLAIGILLIPDTEILESLFGEFPRLSVIEFWFFIGSAILLTFLLLKFSQKIIFYIISPELAKAEKWGPRINLLFLLIFAFTVALGIKLVGTLLMGALTIIPASVAKNFSRNMTWYVVLSLVFGGVIAVGGLFIASSFHLLPGPAIILLGVGLFIVSLVFKKG